MKLWMICLGGKIKGANTEIHDIQFVVAESVHQAHKVLRDHWYGDPYKLHIDSYMEVKGGDGYQINVVKQKEKQSNQLYFLQLGGYDEDHLQELHEGMFVASESPEQAKLKAGFQAEAYHEQGHIDYVGNVEEVMHSVDGEKYYIELLETSKDFNMVPDWFGYQRIDQA